MRYPSASLVALSGLHVICLHQSIAFAPTSRASVRQLSAQRHATFVRKAAAKNDDNTDDGMANAFKALDGLSADDFVDEDDPAPSPVRETSEEDGATASFDGGPEEEIEMYKKMMNEVCLQQDIVRGTSTGNEKCTRYSKIYKAIAIAALSTFFSENINSSLILVSFSQ